MLLPAGIDTIPIPLSHALVDAPCEGFHRFHVAEHLVVDCRNLDSHGNKACIALFVVDTPAPGGMAQLAVVFKVKPGCLLICIANCMRHPRDCLRAVIELDLVVGLKRTAGKSAIGIRKRKQSEHDALHGRAQVL